MAVPAIEVITGPTGSGKSRIAFERALRDPTIEIVNADRSAMYRGFDIGTAKPSLLERSQVRHHLIDILSPTERFSAGDYSTRARASIREILSRGMTPLVVGGTGFYITALFDGIIEESGDEAEMELARKRAEAELERDGFDALLAKLSSVDPILHEQIARERNPVRLIRAWQYFHASGQSLGSARQQKAEPFEYPPHYTVLDLDRELLSRRIELRVDEMLARGWLEEVRSLLADGVNDDAPAMKAIGYAELARVVRHEQEMDLAREAIIHRTRQYAKRQLTWARKYFINRS